MAGRTIGDAAAAAIRTGDAREAGRLAESLRARGLDYADVMEFFRGACERRGVAFDGRDLEALLLEDSERDL